MTDMEQFPQDCPECSHQVHLSGTRHASEDWEYNVECERCDLFMDLAEYKEKYR